LINPTNTFGDILLPTHPERKCFYDFTCWSVERYPTEKERKEEPNVSMIIENEVFFYRPFHITIHNMETGEEKDGGRI